MSLTAITNTNVYDSTTGNFHNQNILIEDEKIHSILSNTEIPNVTQVIDGADTYVTPGLIDTCSQIGLKEIGVRWEGNDSNEPQEHNAFKLQVIDGIYPFDRAFDDAVSSGVTAAHVVSSPQNIVGAQTAVIHTQGKTVEEMTLHKTLGYSFSMGDIPKSAHWEKSNTPLTRMGIAQQMRTTLSQLKMEQELRNIPIFIRSHRADDIATAIRIAELFELQIIMIHGTEYGELITPSSDYPAAIIAGPCFQPIERNELRKLSPALYKKLEDKNRPLLFATDHPTNSVQHLQLEGALAINAGVSEKEVLNGLTKNAAELLKIDHLTGSIKEGLFADLVFWNQHPLHLTAKAIRTFIKGKEVYKEVENNA